MRKLLLSVFAIALSSVAAFADGGRTAFMVVTNVNGGRIAKVELGNKEGFKGPVLDRSTGTLNINGHKYPIDRIGQIRFTYGEATGIESVTAETPKTEARRKGVYNLQGSRVADKVDSSLPKGIYIVDGRKVVVR